MKLAPVKLVWIVIDRSTFDRPRVTCRRCKELVDIPFDTPLGVPSAVLNAFLKLHQDCKGTAIPLPAPARRKEPAIVN